MHIYTKGIRLNILLAIFLLLTLFSFNVAASVMPNALGNFTMLDTSGLTIGGTNDVAFTWDNTVNTSEFGTNFNMSIASDGQHLFSFFPWFAHHIRVFGEGTYIFETDNTKCSVADIESTGCPGDGGATSITMTVGSGQFGAHILLDWNNVTNIDIVNVWDVDGQWLDVSGHGDYLNDLWTGPVGYPPDGFPFGLVSRDANGDGINGVPMIDGPFIGFSANFNAPYSFVDRPPQQVSGNGTISILFCIVIVLFEIATRKFYIQPASAFGFGSGNSPGKAN